MGQEHREYKRDKACRYSRPTGPLGASMAQHTSLHEDLDLLLAEGILPLPILVDEVGGARRAAPPVFPSLGSPPGSPLERFLKRLDPLDLANHSQLSALRFCSGWPLVADRQERFFGKGSPFSGTGVSAG